MSPKQQAYVRHRSAGLGQERAALAAGYAQSSAKVIASRMERNPEIRAAIDAARPPAGAAPEYADAEAYLLAVVMGTAAPDPVRVGAARAILPYQRARQRVPLKAATASQMRKTNERNTEQSLLDDWATKAAAVRERLGRKR